MGAPCETQSRASEREGARVRERKRETEKNDGEDEDRSHGVLGSFRSSHSGWMLCARRRPCSSVGSWLTRSSTAELPSAVVLPWFGGPRVRRSIQHVQLRGSRISRILLERHNSNWKELGRRRKRGFHEIVQIHFWRERRGQEDRDDGSRAGQCHSWRRSILRGELHVPLLFTERVSVRSSSTNGEHGGECEASSPACRRGVLRWLVR